MVAHTGAEMAVAKTDTCSIATYAIISFLQSRPQPWFERDETAVITIITSVT